MSDIRLIFRLATSVAALAASCVLTTGAVAQTQTLEAVSGRVLKIDVPSNGQEVEDIRILERPEHGRLTVDPDLTALSLVSDDPGFEGTFPIRFEISFADGSSETVERRIEAVPGMMESGYGTGIGIYMLKTDADGDVVLEPGENHRKIYVSNSDSALGWEDIAAQNRATVPDRNRFEWLEEMETPYGTTPDLAVTGEVGRSLWYGSARVPSSNWLLLERGYSYAMDRLAPRGGNGESPLHPLAVTAWGEGDRPILTDEIFIYQRQTENFVVTEVAAPAGITALLGENILFEDVLIGGESAVFQGVTALTFRDSEILDSARNKPVNGGQWEAHPDRKQGMYVSEVDGLLLEGLLMDHNGWEEGYDPDNSSEAGQPPSMYSHNLYLQRNTRDVTVRNSVTMRAASAGLQARGGAFIEDNLFLDNHFAFNAAGGSETEDGRRAGNWTTALGNVVTSAGHREADQIGAVSMGIDDNAPMTLEGNIVAHLADPNNPEEFQRKKYENMALNGDRDDHFLNDTIVYNWDGSRNPDDLGNQERNVDGLDRDRLDNTTIQLYAADLLGQSAATIDDYGTYLRRLTASGEEIDTSRVLTYFREGFGIEAPVREAAATLTFVPNALSDGQRWDNRLNWDSGDLPGTVDGDSVDLNGSRVVYGGTTSLQDLDFGNGGTLVATHGFLEIATPATAGPEGGEIELDRAGQVWLSGYGGEGPLAVSVSGGRFVNTGTETGEIHLTARDGETILATGEGRMTLGDGSRLVIEGGAADIGFDGSGGEGVLELSSGAAMRFVAREGALGSVGEFYSGAFEPSEITSRIALSGRLELDLLELEETGVYELIRVDQLDGSFDDIQVEGLGRRSVEIYQNDVRGSVAIKLLPGGNGAIDRFRITSDGVFPES